MLGQNRGSIRAAATVVIPQSALVASQTLLDALGGDIEAREYLIRFTLTLQRDARTDMNCDMG
ncbi:MAG: hypothetical protein VCB06_08430 [Alphaproteobacteria bacterium]